MSDTSAPVEAILRTARRTRPYPTPDLPVPPPCGACPHCQRGHIWLCPARAPALAFNSCARCRRPPTHLCLACSAAIGRFTCSSCCPRGGKVCRGCGSHALFDTGYCSDCWALPMTP